MLMSGLGLLVLGEGGHERRLVVPGVRADDPDAGHGRADRRDVALEVGEERRVAGVVVVRLVADLDRVERGTEDLLGVLRLVRGPGGTELLEVHARMTFQPVPAITESRLVSEAGVMVPSDQDGADCPVEVQKVSSAEFPPIRRNPVGPSSLR
jgi:hypothetical protein